MTAKSRTCDFWQTALLCLTALASGCISLRPLVRPVGMMQAAPTASVATCLGLDRDHNLLTGFAVVAGGGASAASGVAGALTAHPTARYTMLGVDGVLAFSAGMLGWGAGVNASKFNRLKCPQVLEIVTP